MDLYTWLPGVFVLGLAVMAVMFWFVRACDKV
jgi:hypothetical protein